MKKLLAICLATLLLLSCVACGQKPEPDLGKDNDVSIGTNAEDDSQAVPDDSTEESTDATDESAEDLPDESVDTTTESAVSTDDAGGDTTTAENKTTTTTKASVTDKSTTKSSVTDKATTTSTSKSSVADKTTAVSSTKSSVTSKFTTSKTTTKSQLTSTTTTTSSKVLTTDSTTTKKPTTQSTGTTKSTKKTITVKTTTTVSTTDESERKTIRILAVGNSFSVDAMEKHLWYILHSAGYEEIILGNLYIGGCSLDTHWNNARSQQSAYTYYSTSTGVWKRVDNVDIMRGVNSGSWDIITVQQASPDSGKPETYANLSKLVDWLREKQPRAKFYFHMTWAYQQNSTHSAFPKYNSDQMTMYNAICTTVQSKVLAVNTIQGVIPCGTTIQNLRTSSLGDTLTSDGYHLSNSYGDYAAALTWYCYLLNGSPEDVTYRPSSIEDHFDEIAESVVNAIKNPYKVTPCT